jgi:hypothetical protein
MALACASKYAKSYMGLVTPSVNCYLLLFNSGIVWESGSMPVGSGHWQPQEVLIIHLLSFKVCFEPRAAIRGVWRVIKLLYVWDVGVPLC